jgi:hypothetical protein
MTLHAEEREFKKNKNRAGYERHAKTTGRLHGEGEKPTWGGARHAQRGARMLQAR